MNVILIGSHGQLGRNIADVLEKQRFITLIPTQSNMLDVTKPKSIDIAIEKYQPHTIISTAAYHNVDGCEANPQKCFEINTIGAYHLAAACKKNDIPLVHFSTNYVFGADSKKNTPYTETDTPAPMNTYGHAKYAGEYFIQQTPKHFLIRTSGLFGSHGPTGNQKNFVDSILAQSKQQEIYAVSDQILSPTYSTDLAIAVGNLIQTTKYGLYHITNSDVCSWFTFAKEIIKIINSSSVVKPITSRDYYSSVPRPKYSVLENTQVRNAGMKPLRSWQEALKQYLTNTPE